MSRWDRFITFLISALYFYTTVKEAKTQRCQYEQNQTWHVLGIYSACYNQSNRTKINRLAEDLDEIVSYMWQFRINDENEGHLNVKYISIDVCNNFSRLP